MKLIDAINNRTSRRVYEKSAINNKDVIQLKQLIKEYNDSQNLKMEWIDDASDAFNSFSKTYGMFSNVRSLIVLKGLKSDKNNYEKLGYYGELLVLHATSYGLGTCWVGGTFDKDSNIFNIQDNEEMVAVIVVGNIKKDKNFKEKMISRLTHLNSKNLDHFYKSKQEAPEWFMDGIKSVVKAPSTRNKQPVRFEYDNDVVKVYVIEESYYDLIDLGIAKAHFEIASNIQLPFENNSSIDLKQL